MAPREPVKREGDGKAPAGIFDLGTAFGYAAQPLPGLKLPVKGHDFSRALRSSKSIRLYPMRASQPDCLELALSASRFLSCESSGERLKPQKPASIKI